MDPRADERVPDSDVALLVGRARGGDQLAWNELVDRFNPLVMATVRRHRLSAEDGDDVGQVVWLRLVQHLDTLREPRALAGWIRTTAVRECLRMIRERRRTVLRDPLAQDARFETAACDDDVGERLAQEDEFAELLEAFALLSTRQRELLTMMMTDPPPSYLQISQRLGIPVGAIGPTRARAIASLRRGLTASTTVRGVRHAEA